MKRPHSGVIGLELIGRTWLHAFCTDHAQRGGWSTAAFGAERRLHSFFSRDSAPSLSPLSRFVSFSGTPAGKRQTKQPWRQTIRWYSCRDISHGKKKVGTSNLTSTSTIFILPSTSLAASCGDRIKTWHEAQRVRSKRLNGKSSGLGAAEWDQ